MPELANIEGGEIVIRIPIDGIPYAASVALDEAYGFEQHSIKVTDAMTAAKAITRYLNDEDEQGSTVLHFALDKAVIAAVEQGEEGFDSASGTEARQRQDREDGLDPEGDGPAPQGGAQ